VGRILSKLACLALALTVLVGGLSLFPSWGAAVGLDFRDLPASVDAIERNLSESEQLDQELLAAERRASAKQAVARQLAAGRLTLLEAAARFRDIEGSQESPPFIAAAEYRRPGSAGERFCRTAINLAEAESAAAPGASDDRIRALRDELRDRLRRGDLRLPPVAPAEPEGTFLKPSDTPGDRRRPLAILPTEY
jgi:hypothetical protein